MKMYFTVHTEITHQKIFILLIIVLYIHTYIGTYFKELLNDTKYHMP